jgi:transcription initiation factor TFIID subunit 6
MYCLKNYRYYNYVLFPCIIIRGSVRNSYSSFLLDLQMYFDKIAELTMSRSDTPLFKEALVSLSKDSGLHPLVPYFSYFIADEVVHCTVAFIITYVVDWRYLILCIPSQFQVTRSLSDLPVLFALMRVVQSLLRNPHIHIEPYVSGWA